MGNGVHQETDSLDRPQGIAGLFSLAQEKAQAKTRFHGDGWTHVQGINAILEDNDNFKYTRPYQLATAIHDLVSVGTRNDEELDLNFISDYVEHIAFGCPDRQQRVEAIYALGIAIGRYHLERQLEQWRGRFAPHSVPGEPLDTEEDSFYSELLKMSLQVRPNEEITDDRIERTKEAIGRALFDGGAEVTADLLRFRLPIDILYIVELLKDNDLDAVRVAAAEELDNQRKPHPERPASTWRDAIEGQLLAYLLQMMGDNQLASVLRSRSLLYLNQDSPLLEQAHMMHDAGEEFMDRHETKLQMLMNESYLQVMHEFALPVPRQAKQSSRVKMRGAILEKIHKSKKYTAEETIPDIIGCKQTIGDLPGHVNKTLFMFHLGKRFTEELHTRGHDLPLRIGHTSDLDHTVEITYGSAQDLESCLDGIKRARGVRDVVWDGEQAIVTIGVSGRKESDGEYHIVVAPARESKLGDDHIGYQAIHVNAVHTINGDRPKMRLGAEFRFVEDSADENNEIGYAADFLYRAQNTMGELGEAMRAGDNVKVKTLVETSLKQVRQIHRRAKLLKEGTNLWLHPLTINQLSILVSDIPYLGDIMNDLYRDIYPPIYTSLLSE